MLRCFIVLMLLAFPVTAAAAAPGEPLKAPTHLYPEPDIYFLLRLPGDRAHVRYTPGSLDRAANLQTRLELTARMFDNWAKKLQIEFAAYVMSREEWQEARLPIPYGVPTRVGTRGIAAPAAGDEGTVALWNELLEGVLPSVAGLPLRGTPQQAATLAVADLLVQLQAAEILIDELALGGDDYWVRSVLAHVASSATLLRIDPARLRDVDMMYQLLSRRRALKSVSARDFVPEVDLREWLWFQAQCHRGAQEILAKEGKDAIQKMVKLRKKGKGQLRGEVLLRKYDGLSEWYYATFATVSLQR